MMVSLIYLSFHLMTVALYGSLNISLLSLNDGSLNIFLLSLNDGSLNISLLSLNDCILMRALIYLSFHSMTVTHLDVSFIQARLDTLPAAIRVLGKLRGRCVGDLIGLVVRLAVALLCSTSSLLVHLAPFTQHHQEAKRHDAYDAE